MGEQYRGHIVEIGSRMNNYQDDFPTPYDEDYNLIRCESRTAPFVVRGLHRIGARFCILATAPEKEYIELFRKLRAELLGVPILCVDYRNALVPEDMHLFDARYTASAQLHDEKTGIRAFLKELSP